MGEQGEQGENEDGATVCEGQQHHPAKDRPPLQSDDNFAKQKETGQDCRGVWTPNFGEAMMVFLGKQSDQIYMDYTVFQRSLEKLSE